MYKNDIYEILENKLLAKDVYKMILKGDTKYIKAPGQFINLKIDGCYLRRPISISDYDENTITIIYKIVGKGTEIMSKMNIGEKLDILTGLGNGFNKSLSGQKPLLIAGGVGTPPMYKLCKELIKDGKKPIVVLGFNSKEDVFYEDEFKELGAEVYVSTADAYRNVTPKRPKQSLSELLQQPIDTWKDTVKNDFEDSVFCKYPEIAAIKDKMYDMGALYAAMSGSGSSVFGFFKEPVAYVDETFAGYFCRQRELE